MNSPHESRDERHKKTGAPVRVANGVVVLCSFDLRGVFLQASSSCEEAWGYRPEELIGKKLSVFLPTESRQAFEAVLARPGQALGRFETQLASKNGALLRLSWTGIWVGETLAAVAHEDQSGLAEGTLLASQRLFQTFMNHSPTQAWIIDEEGNFVYCNDAFAMRLGLGAGEIVGRNVFDLFKENHATVYLEDNARIHCTGKTLTMMEHAPSSNGTLGEFLLYKFPVQDAGPRQLTGGVAVDLTERRDAEARVRRLNRLYAVSSGVNEAIARIRDAEQLYRAACRLVVEEGLLRMAWVCLYDENSSHLRVAAAAGHDEGYVQEVLSVARIKQFSNTAGGMALSSRRPAVCNDLANKTSMVNWPEGAAVRGYKSTAAFPLQSSGKLYGALIMYADQSDFFSNEEVRLLSALAEDISFAIESAEKELERIKAVEALRESQQTLSALLGNLPGVAFRSKPSGQLEFVTEGCFQLTGYRPEELVQGKVTTLREMIYKDDRAATDAIVQSALKEQKQYDATYRIRTADGAQKFVWERGRGFYDDCGELIRLEGFLSDITERKKLEMQILRAQRMESIGTLAGGIAHDLNNILAPILMSIGVLRMRLDTPEDMQMLEALEKNAHRGAEMIKQILSFARGLEGKRLLLEPILLVREIEKMARETFPRSIRIEIDCSPGAHRLQGDPTQLHQVLLNLCVNARDSMPEGGTLSLTVRNTAVGADLARSNPEANPGEYVIFEISDTGTGIEADVRERIFEPFFTTKDLGKGTGLGLSTTLAIVKSHGGFIDLWTEPGVGTCFKVYLPAHTNVAQEEDIDGADALPQGEGQVILIVDDEPAILSLTTRILGDAGYRTLTALNGAEGCNVYNGHRSEIAAVITDMMMPVMDGPAFINAIQKIDPQVRIIGVSGLAGDDRVARALQAGIHYFLPKPFTSETLLRTLGQLLRG